MLVVIVIGNRRRSMCKGPEAIKSRAPLEKHRVWGELRVPG